MVLEHQVLVHNVMSRANLSVQKRLYDNDRMAKYFDLKKGEYSDTTKSLISTEADNLLKAMLMTEETELEGWGVEGNDVFQEDFKKGRPEDADGKSLSDLHLLSRIFKYRLSYLIYSESFDALPSPLKTAFY